MTTATKLIDPGVYFGMSEQDYHGDPALGSHALMRLLVSPENWRWEQSDNPLREFQPDSAALKFGRAVHAMVLEGTQAFESRFARKPVFPDDCLVTQEQLKDHCKFLGLKVSGTKGELAERIRTVDTTTPLEPEIMQRFEQQKGDKDVLSDAEYARILLAEQNIMKNTYHAEAFTGGMPEVSVFWVKNGVRVKCRIDYLRPQECVDLKSTANWAGDTLEESWSRTVRTRRYDMQAAHYMEGRSVLAHFLADGDYKVQNGPKPSKAWIDALVRTKDPTWLWIVYQSEGAPISQAFRAYPGGDWWDRAGFDCERAIEKYKLNKAVYGDGLWWRQRAAITMTDQSFPPWWLNRQEI